MNREQILNTIKELAQSQGFYGRLYQSLVSSSNSEETDNFLDLLEEQNFTSKLDLVLFLEGEC